mgnify:CR=1 FL=1
MRNFDDIKDQLDEEGYARLESVVPPAAFDALEAAYAAALEERIREWKARGKVRQDFVCENGFKESILMLCKEDDFPRELLSELDATVPHKPFAIPRSDYRFCLPQAFLDLIKGNALLDCMETIIGSEIAASPNQHCRIKLPQEMTSGAFRVRPGETIFSRTMWHQDISTQVQQSDETRLITVWIPTQDVSEQDGCLIVAPGQHKNQQLLPIPIPPEELSALEKHFLPLPCKRGDAILLDRRLPHSALPNLAGRVRWSFDVRLYPAGQPSDRPWLPSILLRSTSQPEKVMTNADDWKEEWVAACKNLVESNSVMPGRREFAMFMAESMILSWEEGNYPVYA